MSSGIIFGILLGATIGLGVGLLGSRAGGTCPITCNPFIGAVFGAVVGGLAASTFSSKTPAYTRSTNLLELATSAEFESRVLNAEGLALVEFYTPKCQYCRRLEPTMNALADRFAGKATVAKLNLRAMPEPAQQYGIEKVPTIILFKAGKEAERLVGFQEEGKFVALLDKHVPAETPQQTPH
jgi:thioredoxin 1